MLFPTLKKKKNWCKKKIGGGGGGVVLNFFFKKNNYFSFHIFMLFSTLNKLILKSAPSLTG